MGLHSTYYWTEFRADTPASKESKPRSPIIPSAPRSVADDLHDCLSFGSEKDLVLDGTGSITIVAMATVQRDRGEAERGKK